MSQPTADYDAVINAVAAEFWNLAPAEIREHGHADLVFEVTHQDLLAAFERGVEAALVDGDSAEI